MRTITRGTIICIIQFFIVSCYSLYALPTIIFISHFSLLYVTLLQAFVYRSKCIVFVLCEVDDWFIVYFRALCCHVIGLMRRKTGNIVTHQ